MRQRQKRPRGRPTGQVGRPRLEIDCAEALRLMQAGDSSQEIARKLHLSVRTLHRRCPWLACRGRFTFEQILRSEPPFLAYQVAKWELWDRQAWQPDLKEILNAPAETPELQEEDPACDWEPVAHERPFP